jgi:DNA-binding PadR family transcriptional regulator
MLELAVLGLLKERAMHGYELRKQLSARLGFFWTVSFGSLYPTLRKMERRGLVEKMPVDTSRRRKQVYRITPDGEREFLNLLVEGSATAWEEDKFPLRLAFFRYLRPEVRIRLLERRRAYLEDKLAEGRRSLSRAKDGDSYMLSLIRHGCEVTAHDIAWLDELLAAERSHARDDARDGANGTREGMRDDPVGAIGATTPPADALPQPEPGGGTDPDDEHEHLKTT